jgi:LEA14-like dessication related protein
MRKHFFLLLIIPFLASCKTPQIIPPVPPALNVIEPDFQIVSIAIIQAELINTEFEAVLKIDNPNEFPVELSSISYELHGNGMFWADGRDNDIILVPAKSSCETKFCFSMNFINMNRNILDDVIKMRNVLYRFKGDVEVKAAVYNVPHFRMDFDCSGLSEVKQKAG